MKFLEIELLGAQSQPFSLCKSVVPRTPRLRASLPTMAHPHCSLYLWSVCHFPFLSSGITYASMETLSLQGTFLTLPITLPRDTTLSGVFHFLYFPLSPPLLNGCYLSTLFHLFLFISGASFGASGDTNGKEPAVSRRQRDMVRFLIEKVSWRR